MKRTFKIFAVVIITFVVGVLGYTYFSFNYYSPADPEVEVDQSRLAYFQNSYNDCRKAFLFQSENLKQKFDSVEIYSIPVKSKTEDDLTIDFCYIPAKDTTMKLLVINSGIHGIEGFVEVQFSKC